MISGIQFRFQTTPSASFWDWENEVAYAHVQAVQLFSLLHVNLAKSFNKVFKVYLILEAWINLPKNKYDLKYDINIFKINKRKPSGNESESCDYNLNSSKCAGVEATWVTPSVQNNENARERSEKGGAVDAQNIGSYAAATYNGASW